MGGGRGQERGGRERERGVGLQRRAGNHCYVTWLQTPEAALPGPEARPPAWTLPAACPGGRSSRGTGLGLERIPCFLTH